MPDTSEEMLQKQRDILHTKTLRERFQIGAEMIDFGRNVVISNIRRNTPSISEIDLKIELLKRYYGNFFSQVEMEIIIQSMKSFYNTQK